MLNVAIDFLLIKIILDSAILVRMEIIGGCYKKRKLICPKGLLTRPTSSRLREAVFNMCQSLIDGAYVLDLFAGSGAIGLEALSRGAKQSWFVENNRQALLCLSKNISLLGVQDKSHIIPRHVLSFLESNTQTFDLIYVDPPYGALSKGELISCQILKQIDTGNFVRPSGMVFIEEARVDELEAIQLKMLQLKSKRQIGRSWLYQYITRG